MSFHRYRSNSPSLMLRGRGLGSDQRGRLILTIYLMAVASILALDRLATPRPAVENALIFISDADSIDASRDSNSVYRIRLDGGGGSLGSRWHRPADTQPSMKRIVGSIRHGDGYLRIADIDCHAASQSLVIASQQPDLNGFHHALLDGSGLHLDGPAAGDLLTSLRQIALAPDGIRVIVSRQYREFAQPRFGLVAGDLGSRVYESIKSPSAERSYLAPAWSPDGRQIVYIAEEWTGDSRPAYHLAIAAPSGRGEVIIHESNAPINDVAWSPDGAWLALEMSSQIYKLRPDGSGLTQLSNHQAGASSPRWSPDGRRISFVVPSSFSGFNQIITMGADGGQIKQIANIRGDVVNGCWVDVATQPSV